MMLFFYMSCSNINLCDFGQANSENAYQQLFNDKESENEKFSGFFYS